MRSSSFPRFALLLAAWSLPGCAAHVPRVPGPLGPVGRAAPPVPEWVEPSGVTPPPPPSAAAGAPPEPDGGISPFVASVLDAADHYLRHRPARDDCSGYVCAVYTRAGLTLRGDTRTLWKEAQALGAVYDDLTPRVGDLAFFDNTYDRNGNGRWDDPLSHVAVVLSVDPDGTVTLAHGGTSKGRTTMRMNLFSPSVHVSPEGKELNSYLRTRRRGDPRSWRYLSGELWRGFARMEPFLDGAAAHDP